MATCSTRQPVAGGSGVLAFPFDDDDRRQVARVLEPPPRAHVGDRVGAEHEEQLVAGAEQRFERVGGDRRALAFDLDRARLDAVDSVDRELDQREPIRAPTRRPGRASATGRRRDHEHPIEAEPAADLGGHDDVADVHGIEGAAEHADALALVPPTPGEA